MPNGSKFVFFICWSNVFDTQLIDVKDIAMSQFWWNNVLIYRRCWTGTKAPSCVVPGWSEQTSQHHGAHTIVGNTNTAPGLLRYFKINHLSTLSSTWNRTMSSKNSYKYKLNLHAKFIPAHFELTVCYKFAFMGSFLQKGLTQGTEK